ncbi:MAG: ribose-phosphate pyrophosphokinase [Ruminococcaceae bacterium]|nr:ribose-phosphate pyrophosphokinase [Oscillospiraceae bacterium]
MQGDSISLLHMPVGTLGIVGMESCQEITEKINKYLVEWRAERHIDISDANLRGYSSEDYRVPVRCPRFGSGEGKGIISHSVRGYDLYLLVDTFNYGVTYKMYGKEVPMSPDDHYQDLKRVIAAAGGKARRITVIMPMLYEGRQHRRTARESLDCALALQELVSMGVDNIITFDAHDPRVQNAVPLEGFENIMPTYQFLKALKKTVPDINIDRKKLMMISPDEGAMSRCMYYSSVLNVDLGMFYKRRDYSVIVNGRNPIVAHEFLGDSVQGKDVIVVDDMISSGDSMLDIAVKLKERGASRIFMFATFGLFTDGLAKFDSAYADNLIDKVFTTNLVYRTPELRARDWYSEVDMSKYIAYIIDNLNHDRTISELLNPIDRINKLLGRV